MKRSIPIRAFHVSENVQIEPHKDGHLITWPKENGRMTLSGQSMALGGVDWKDATHLILEVTGLEEFDPAFVMVFMGGQSPEDPSAIVNVGALPGMQVKIPFKLSALDSNQMFFDRTPGRLKEIVLGRGVALSAVQAFIFTMKKCHIPQKFILHDIYLTDKEPDYTVHHEPVVDKLGQLKTRGWPGKTASEEEMIEKLHTEFSRYPKDNTYAGWSRFGGDTSVQWEATGYFRTHHDGKRWFLVDPEGYRFISTGMDCCIPGEKTFYTDIENLFDELPDEKTFAEAYEKDQFLSGVFHGDFVCWPIVNMKRAFGGSWEDKWTKLTKNRLIDWGFTTIGNWSDPNFIQKAELPFVWPLEDFPTTKKLIFRDFPDVYDDEYQRNSNTFAEQMKAFVGNPYMIGYFLRNEPTWAFVQNLLIAEKLLESPADTVSKQVFIQELKDKYNTVEKLNEAWNQGYRSFDDLNRPQQNIAAFSDAARRDAEDFSRKMIRRYVTLPSKACKAVDPDHMNLGMRYSMLVDPILLEGYENFDVFSLNGYQESPYEEVQQAGEMTGMPVIIGEFHFGAPDAGLLSAGICSVATQKDRGLAYRQYYENGMNSPYFVGAHYFILNDQPVLGRFDGENMQNGMVDVCQQPYEVCIAEVKKTNLEIYEIADGKRTKPAPEIHRIPRLMGF